MPAIRSGTLLALDVGEKRIGVARASMSVRIAQPLVTLSNDAEFLAGLKAIIVQEDVSELVIGYPRGLHGQSTHQTEYVEVFSAQLKTLELPIHFQDEAVTSEKAESELKSRGKNYRKEDIDALAATYILEDYLGEHEAEFTKQ
jgi:putative Holliday junction resolvase